MPPQLEWEIEDNPNPLPDIAPEAGRASQGCRRWLGLLALILAISAVGLGFLRFKAMEKRDEIQDGFRAAVELELAALMDRDRDLFLNWQDPDDRSWQRLQETTFNDYQRWTARSPWEDAPQAPEYTGKVPVLQVEEDEAWAEVEVERGDLAWRELWFYRWVKEAGWRHARLPEGWLGEEKAIITSHLRLTFPRRDEAIIHALAREMEAWIGVLAPLIGVPPSGEKVLEVEFYYREPRSTAAQPYWFRDSFTLKALSPHQGPLSEHGGPSAFLRQQMAGFLAEAMIAHQAGVYPTQDVASAVNPLRDELQDWATARVARMALEDPEWDTVPTPLIDALVVRDGIGSLPALIASLDGAETVPEALAAAGLDPLGPEILAAYCLTAEMRAVDHLDVRSLNDHIDPQSDSAWRQSRRDTLNMRQQAAQSGAVWPAPSALRIQSITLADPIAWIEAEMTRGDGAVYRQTHFCRYSDEQWQLTSPDPAYLGQRRTARTENFVFQYFERDAAWFEERLPRLQSVFTQAASDLGIPTAGIVITVESRIETREVTGLALFSSPTIEGWRVDRPDDWLPQAAIPLLGSLLQSRVEIVTDENIPYFLANVGAFIWELERLFSNQIDWELWIGSSLDKPPPARLSDLWPTLGADYGEWERIEDFAGYYAFFRFASDTYGPGAVPVLVDNALALDDLDGWLRRSVGEGLTEIEPRWQSWIAENYGE